MNLCQVIIYIMENKMTFRPYVFSTILLTFCGWSGVVLLLFFSQPTLWPRWGLYVSIVLAGTGMSIPISYWFNKVFSTKKYVTADVIVRESVSIGVYFAILTWLSIGRALNFTIVMWLALGLIIVEYLLRLREREKKAENDTP